MSKCNRPIVKITEGESVTVIRCALEEGHYGFCMMPYALAQWEGAFTVRKSKD